MGGTVGSFDCEGDVAEKDRSSKEESEARVRSSGAKHRSLLQSFEKECERDRVAYSNALRAHSADNKEEGGTKECL